MQAGSEWKATGTMRNGSGVLGFCHAEWHRTVSPGAPAMVSLHTPAGKLGSSAPPFDLPGVAVLISAGRRVAAVWKPAALGACIGIALRTIGHALLT